MKLKRILGSALGVLTLFTLGSCNSTTPEVTPTPTPEVPTEKTEEVTPTPTPTPIPTPVPVKEEEFEKGDVLVVTEDMVKNGKVTIEKVQYNRIVIPADLSVDNITVKTAKVRNSLLSMLREKLCLSDGTSWETAFSSM